MRDWNMKSASLIVAPSSFVAYLWGIETKCFYYLSKLAFQFVAYLWGIETILEIRYGNDGYGL